MSILHRIRWGRVSLASAAVLGLGLWLSDSEETTAASVGALDDKPGQQSLLTNRPWIDHVPRDERDMVTQVVFLDRGGKKDGAMARASRWRQVVELFRWEQRSGGVTVELPQVGRKIPVNAQARPCKDAPKPFDLCLDITLLGKGVRLYSKKEWTIRSLEEVDALLIPDPNAVDLDTDDEALLDLLTQP